MGKCSGGEQQRLRFALALLPDPQLLILDEPTAGMDAGARREFWETMHAETSGGRTVTATLPEDRRDDALTRLRAMPGVREVRPEGERVRIEGSASDDIALVLLSELGARDLEVSVPSLESAFFALTQEGRDA